MKILPVNQKLVLTAGKYHTSRQEVVSYWFFIFELLVLMFTKDGVLTNQCLQRRIRIACHQN